MNSKELTVEYLKYCRRFTNYFIDSFGSGFNSCSLNVKSKIYVVTTCYDGVFSDKKFLRSKKALLYYQDQIRRLKIKIEKDKCKRTRTN